MTRTATLDRPESLAFKVAATDMVVDGTTEVREDEGVVTAVVSVTGVIDEVDDIIEPGAYRETLTKRKPKVCWHHSWEQPIGRVLHIEELSPGDPRLPNKTRDGKAWPKEAGALIASMQFNMKSDRGREAFEAVRFYSESGECEWSIGYVVPAGKASRDTKGTRRIKAMELYELSFVLFGAHTMTGTLDLKAAVAVMMEHKSAGHTTITLDEIKDTLDRLGIEHKIGKPADDTDPPADAPPADQPPADAPPADAPPADQPPADAPPADVPPDDQPADQPPADAPPADEQPVDDDPVTGDPDELFPIDEGDPEEPPADAPPADEHVPADELDGHLDGFDPPNPDDKPDDQAATKALVDQGADPWYLAMATPGREVKRKMTAEQRRNKPTLPGSDDRFPIGDRTDLSAAISSYGRADDADKPKVKRWIIRRARELGAVSMLPDDWNVTKSALPLDADTGIEDVCPGCGDEVVFDTMNGWMRLDGSYSHDSGGTHSDDMDPPEGFVHDEDGYYTRSRGAAQEALWQATEGKATTPGGRQGDDSPVGEPGGRQNWVDEQGGLPKYIRMVAHAMQRKGHSESRAIAIAVATMKRWAAGGGNVSEKVQAAAAAALAEWEKMKAAAHAKGSKALPKTQTCKYCKDQATKRVLHAEGMAYVPVCDSHESRAVEAVGGQNEVSGVRAIDGKALDTTARDPGENLPPGDDPENTGVMVAVYPDADAAEKIAVRGGLDPADLHVTLAFMGDVTDDAGNGRELGNSMDAIIAAATSAAATHKPMSGKVGGIGKFPDSGDGVPVWSPVDVVGLNALRESVVDALDTAGLPVKTDHGFTPHMTLGYNLDLSLITDVGEVPVEFDHIAVVVGDAKARIPLGSDVDGGQRGQADPPTPMPDDEPKDAGAQTGVKVSRYDPSIEVGPEAGSRSASAATTGPHEGKGFPRLEGTYEERQQRLQEALYEALCPQEDGDSDRPTSMHLSIEGTYPDRVIATVHDWSGAVDTDESYEVPYEIDDEGTVHLDEPERVVLTVTAVGADGEETDEDVPVGDLLPLSEMVQDVVGAFKRLPAAEVKAGRVLSASNAQRLKAAVEHLIHVLGAAGVVIESDEQQTPPNPVVDDTTTAPSARSGEGKSARGDDEPVEIDMSQHESLLADIDAMT